MNRFTRQALSENIENNANVELTPRPFGSLASTTKGNNDSGFRQACSKIVPTREFFAAHLHLNNDEIAKLCGLTKCAVEKRLHRLGITRTREQRNKLLRPADQRGAKNHQWKGGILALQEASRRTSFSPPNPIKKGSMSKTVSRQRQWQIDQVKKGLCVLCARKSAGGSHCKLHRDKQRVFSRKHYAAKRDWYSEYGATYRAARRKLGLCLACGSAVDRDGSYCSKCLIYYRKYSKAHNHIRKAA